MMSEGIKLNCTCTSSPKFVTNVSISKIYLVEIADYYYYGYYCEGRRPEHSLSEERDNNKSRRKAEP